jgi:hypothetical protein
MIRHLLKSEKGQTSIEYVLMIVVSVSFGLTFARKMDDFLIKNPNGIIGAPIKKFTEALNKDVSGRYRYYELPVVRK